MSGPLATGATVPPPGAHGGDVHGLATALGISPREILDLSVTLNPFAPAVAPIIRSVAEEATHYPDRSLGTCALAEAIGVDRRRLLLTNGGAEAIALVAPALPELVVVEPEFALWRKHQVRSVTSTSPEAGVRARSNPNNPTGILASSDETAAVWDEAFYPLSTAQWTRGDARHGAIVVGSLTKVFACPGLRLGYVIASDDELIERLECRQPEWSVNALALAALPRLLDRAELGAWAGSIADARASLVILLQMAGFEIDAADAPWVLVRSAAWLREALGRQGVLVRDCANFGLPGTVRIAVPDDAGLARLETALDRACRERL